MVKVDVVARSVLVLSFPHFQMSHSLNKANLHTKISYFVNAHAGLNIFCLHIVTLTQNCHKSDFENFTVERKNFFLFYKSLFFL